MVIRGGTVLSGQPPFYKELVLSAMSWRLFFVSPFVTLYVSADRLQKGCHSEQVEGSSEQPGYLPAVGN